MNPVARAWIGLGSNLAQPRQQVVAALSALDRLPQTRVCRRSRLYLTPPWGRIDQPAFVNAVAELETRLAPGDLMQALLGIERAAGRTRRERWGPRVIDLDLLLYGDLRSDDAQLRLPHPQLRERAFVLVPLAELAPDLELPPDGCRIAALLATVDRGGIEALG